jgi:hypothetical protein
MSQSELQLPEGFPLPPFDASGRKLVTGQWVRILSVDSCCAGLPLEDQVRLQTLAGSARQIDYFDRFGFAWLSEEAHGQGSSFCLKPSELTLASLPKEPPISCKT